MKKHIAIISYYVPSGRVVAEYDADSDRLWQALNNLQQLRVGYTVTFRTIHEGERNAQVS